MRQSDTSRPEFAHDFNNLLTAVLGNLNLAVRRDMSAKARHLVVQATKAAERGARLTSQLLAFGRKQILIVRDIDLNALISGVGEMLTKTLTPAFEIKLALGSDLWPVLVDGSQLELALVNLVINARDASPQGGTVTIATRNISRNDTDRPDDLVADAEDFVVLTVSDTGTGMTEEVSRRAFEPFFTTKEVGQGTGLGLSMVYGLMKQLGGTVQLESRLGQGTKISLFLPRAGPSQANADPAANEVLHAYDAPVRVGRVLLVDDDGLAREAIAAMLRERGDQVVEAENSDAALAVLDRGEAVDIMVADIIMPGLHGVALAFEARRRRPDLGVLLITGYPGDAPETIAAERIYSVLRKPFRPDELGAMIDICRPGPGALKLAGQCL